MKKISLKFNIFSFLLGSIVFGSIGAYAAYSVLASNIGYTPNDPTWKKSNGEDITNVKDAIDELYTKANEETTMNLLWTNSSPLSAFAAQKINLDLSKYKYIVINATYGGNGLTNDYFTGHKSIIEVGTTSNITGVHGGSNGANHPNGIAATVRKVIVTTSSIEFGDGSWYNGSNQQSNNYAVPLNIWGIK